MSADEPKHYVIGRVHQALAQDPRVGELDIQITVSGSKIFLTGNVGTHERRDAVTEVVRRELPDCEVLNQTSVANYKETEEIERLS